MVCNTLSFLFFFFLQAWQFCFGAGGGSTTQFGTSINIYGVEKEVMLAWAEYISLVLYIFNMHVRCKFYLPVSTLGFFISVWTTRGRHGFFFFLKRFILKCVKYIFKTWNTTQNIICRQRNVFLQIVFYLKMVICSIFLVDTVRAAFLKTKKTFVNIYKGHQPKKESC